MNVREVITSILHRDTSIASLLELLGACLSPNQDTAFDDGLAVFDIELLSGTFTMSIAVDEDALDDENGVPEETSAEESQPHDKPDEDADHDPEEDDESDADEPDEESDRQPSAQILKSTLPGVFTVTLMVPPEYKMEQLERDLSQFRVRLKRGPRPGPVDPASNRWIYHMDANSEFFYGIIFADETINGMGHSELAGITILRFSEQPPEMQSAPKP